MFDEREVAAGLAVALAGLEDQRPDPGKTVDDVVAAERAGNEAVDRREQVIGLVVVDRDRCRAVDLALGRADQRELALIGNDEDDAAVGLLQHEGVAPHMHASRNQVRPLNQPQRRGVVTAEYRPRHLLRPWPGGIDDALGRQTAAIAQGRGPPVTVESRANDAGARQHCPTARAHVLRIGDDQSGVVDPAVPVAERGPELRLQCAPGAIAAQVDPRRSGHDIALGQMVVQPGAGAQHPFGALARCVRQDERLRPADMRRDVEQHFAFGQGFANEAEGVEFQVTQPAVDQLGRRARRRPAKIAGVDQRDRQPAPGRVTRDAGPVDAAADHQQVEDRVHCCRSCRAARWESSVRLTRWA